MDSGDDCPMLLVRNWNEECTLGEFADRAHSYLTELIPMHPLFSNLRLVGKSMKDSPDLMGDLSNLEAWIFKRAWMKKMPTGVVYTELDSNGNPTAASREGMGFYTSVSNLKSWDAKVDIDMRAACGNANASNITLPRKNHPEFQQQPLMGQLLELVVKHWPVRCASVGNSSWFDSVSWTGEPRARDGHAEIGWLTYIADPSIADILPPEVAVKRVGPGVVFQLGDHFSSHERPEDVALGLRVKDALAAAGKLKVANISRGWTAGLGSRLPIEAPSA
jgi:hypothetical protein